jgi:hypothetical protein
MTGTREKPPGLDMPFAEALERFVGVVPSELPESVKLTKKRGPPKLPPSVAGKRGPKGTPD